MGLKEEEKKKRLDVYFCNVEGVSEKRKMKNVDVYIFFQGLIKEEYGTARWCGPVLLLLLFYWCVFVLLVLSTLLMEEKGIYY